MATLSLLERADYSVYYKFSLYFDLLSHCGFEGGTSVLIESAQSLLIFCFLGILIKHMFKTLVGLNVSLLLTHKICIQNISENLFVTKSHC